MVKQYNVRKTHGRLHLSMHIHTQTHTVTHTCILPPTHPHTHTHTRSHTHTPGANAHTLTDLTVVCTQFFCILPKLNSLKTDTFISFNACWVILVLKTKQKQKQILIHQTLTSDKDYKIFINVCMITFFMRN